MTKTVNLQQAVSYTASGVVMYCGGGYLAAEVFSELEHCLGGEVKFEKVNDELVSDIIIQREDTDSEPWCRHDTNGKCYIGIPFGLSGEETRKLMRHEFGHALGLGHTNNGSIMDADYGKGGQYTLANMTRLYQIHLK